MRPINSPFCDKCKMHASEEENISREISFNTFLQAFANKIEEHKIDVRVVDFIGTGWDVT